MTGSVIISSQEINFYLAWIFAVNYRLFADIFLSKITDLGVYSSLNKSLPEKFGKYVDFYSQSRDQMFKLATATATTLNTILGFSQITNGYLNDDGDFDKEKWYVGENSLLDDVIDIKDSEIELVNGKPKVRDNNNVKKTIMFNYFHVQRKAMNFNHYPDNRQTKLNLRKSYEKTHFLYERPLIIGGKIVGKN